MIELKRLIKIYNIVSTVLVALVVLLAVLLAGVRLIGLKPFAVLSGSMEPKYHVGSMIYVKQVAPEELKVGDALTYTMPSGSIVTHGIIEIVESPNGLQFVTKGLANQIEDAPVPASRIIGKPVFSIPYLGFLSNYVQNPPGTYVAIAFALGALLLTFIPELFKEKVDPEVSNGNQPESLSQGDDNSVDDKIFE